MLRARSIKPLARPLAIAGDAGPMEIQLWEGAVLRCAETGHREQLTTSCANKLATTEKYHDDQG